MTLTHLLEAKECVTYITASWEGGFIGVMTINNSAIIQFCAIDHDPCVALDQSVKYRYLIVFPFLSRSLSKNEMCRP